MKKIVSILIMLFCVANINAKRMMPVDNFQGVWEIVSLQNTKGKTVAIKSSNNNRVIVSNPNNSFVFNLGCNEITSNMNIVGRGIVKFQNIASTKKKCSKAITANENNIKAILNKADKYILANDKMIIMSKNVNLMELHKTPSPQVETNESTPIIKLNGSYRILHQIENGETVERNLNKTNITFDAGKGVYSGNVACNSFSGTFKTQENNKIHFTNGNSTQMACQDMEIETAFFKNIENATSYKLDSNHLYLYGNNKLLIMLEKQ